MMTKRTLKRLLAIAMTLSMTISLLNLTAFAAYPTGTDSPASVSLKEGEETDLSVIPGEQVTEQVPGEQVDVASWESQDEAVATVDETGKVTAQSAGTTTVTWVGYYFNPTEEGAEHSYYQLDDPRPGNTDGTKVTISWSITVEKETTPPGPEPDDSVYTITPETQNVNAELARAKAEGKPARITTGTYTNSFSVSDMTLYVDGLVTVTKGVTLNNAIVAGYSKNRYEDQLTISGNGTLLSLRGDSNTLQDVTVSCEGESNGNYIAWWGCQEFIIEHSNFSCIGNQALGSQGTAIGGGLFPAQGSNRLIATDSNLDFSDNSKAGINASMPASDGCNPNAQFDITGGSFTASRNGLNGVESTWRAKLTFVFENTDVEVTDNGTTPYGGRGDGFSYGYVTLKNTDGKTHTFDVSRNGNNGFDGGYAQILSGAALDAQGYQIKANDNGNIGLSLSARNNGKSNITFTDCTVEANNNGLYGMLIRQPFTAERSAGTCQITANGNGKDGIAFSFYSGVMTLGDGVTVTAHQNKGAGLSFSGTSLQARTGAELSLCSNQDSGLKVLKGDVNLEAADVTILQNYTAGNGGGINNGAYVSLPAGAAVYNNHAATSGDDLFCSDAASLFFGTVASGWLLDDCGDAIDGWYQDQADQRWSFHGASSYAEEFTGYGDQAVSGPLALKAAHKELPVEPEPQPPEWQTSKSKTATNLDDRYLSEITLSLPAAEEVQTSDVVFVLDYSSCQDQVTQNALTMLSWLDQQFKATDAAINIGAVVYRGTASERQFALRELNEDSIQDFQEFLTVQPAISGSNMHAGLLAAQDMLEKSNTSDNRKYMILISDGITYTWDQQGVQYGASYISDGGPRYASNSAWETWYSSLDWVPADGWDAYLDRRATLVENTLRDRSSTYNRDHITNCIQPDEHNKYANSVDVALYQCRDVYRQLESKYHCYALLAGTDGQYGASFMNYLADGKTVSFETIKKDIYYLLDAGSQVVDVIGSGVDNKGNEYNFDFVNELDQLELTAGGQSLDKHKISDTSYGFGAENGQYQFVVTYYENGYQGQPECIVWDINVPVSKFATVQLTYTVKLMDPQTDEGTYGVYDPTGSNQEDSLLTNLSATLYPVDSKGTPGKEEMFARPTVSYTVESSSSGGGGGGTTTKYDLVVRYLEQDSEKVLATAYQTSKVKGSSYDVTDRTEKEIDGYEIVEVTGDPLSGTMDSDKEIVVWYAPSEDIEAPETPTTETPETPTDPEAPSTPTDPTQPGDGTALGDPDIPLAEVPETGDNLGLWLALLTLSAAGLLWLSAYGRKKKA